MFRNFFIAVVAIFIPEPFASIDGKRNGEWFDAEKANPASPLSRDTFTNSHDRVSFAFSGWDKLVKEEQQPELAYAWALVEFADLLFGIHAGKISDPHFVDAADEMEAALRKLEPDYPRVSALLTVDQVKTASVQGNWS